MLPHVKHKIQPRLVRTYLRYKIYHITNCLTLYYNYFVQTLRGCLIVNYDPDLDPKFSL